jgi:hypothetical protein
MDMEIEAGRFRLRQFETGDADSLWEAITESTAELACN